MQTCGREFSPRDQKERRKEGRKKEKGTGPAWCQVGPDSEPVGAKGMWGVCMCACVCMWTTYPGTLLQSPPHVAGTLGRAGGDGQGELGLLTPSFSRAPLGKGGQARPCHHPCGWRGSSSPSILHTGCTVTRHLPRDCAWAQPHRWCVCGFLGCGGGVYVCNTQ